MLSEPTLRNYSRELDKKLGSNNQRYGSIQYSNLANVIEFAVQKKLAIRDLANILGYKISGAVLPKEDVLSLSFFDYLSHYDGFDDEEDIPLFLDNFGPFKDEKIRDHIPNLFKWLRETSADLWSAAYYSADFFSFTQPLSFLSRLDDVKPLLSYETSQQAVYLYALISFRLIEAESHIDVFSGFDT